MNSFKFDPADSSRQVAGPVAVRKKEHESQPAEVRKAGDELVEKSELLELASEAILVLDSERLVVFWNRGAERLYGWGRSEVLGKSPDTVLQTQSSTPLPEIEKRVCEKGQWEGELTQTARDGRRVMVTCRFSSRKDTSGQQRWLQVHSDITGRKRAEEELRNLSGRMLNLRDTERRRLARELHDSAGQLLVAATVNLSLFEEHLGNVEPEAARFLSESNKLIAQALSEIRTISHLLHPPLLDEVGLSSALRWYVDGFSERSKIKVELRLPENLGRLRRELELAVFRIVQEGLTNIHRHSGSAMAEIAIEKSGELLRLSVQDHGKGINQQPAGASESQKRATQGVGIRGIQERVRQLGGQMQIRSGDWGTAIECEFPLPAEE
ncbi:MAG TPA: PAS domain-containing sensor histidine kinase [Terriglobales bacterium]|nr:PAS domain-containing sensor histidine kinase [Terriglobales bacterium]